MLDFIYFFWTCTVSSMSLQNSSEAVDAPWLRFCARNQKFNWWVHVPGFPESHWLIVWGKPSTAQLYAVGCIVPLLEALDQLFATNVSWLMPVSNLWERVYKKKKVKFLDITQGYESSLINAESLVCFSTCARRVREKQVFMHQLLKCFEFSCVSLQIYKGTRI